MAGRGVPGGGPAVMLHGGGATDGDSRDGASPQRHDTEVRRMAAFRVRETANRIAVLANSAQSEALRQTLRTICQRLAQEERGLLGDLDASADA